MTVKECIANFLSHFAPLTLIKQVFPAHKSSFELSHSAHENQPWKNVDKIELTAEDFT